MQEITTLQNYTGKFYDAPDGNKVWYFQNEETTYSIGFDMLESDLDYIDSNDGDTIKSEPIWYLKEFHAFKHTDFQSIERNKTMDNIISLYQEANNA